MSEAQICRELIAAGKIVYQRGMETTNGPIVNFWRAGRLVVYYGGHFQVKEYEYGQLELDLEGPGTKSCLLEQARKAWNDPFLHVWYSYTQGHWVWTAHGLESEVHGGQLGYETELAAILAAISMSPEGDHE